MATLVDTPLSCFLLLPATYSNSGKVLARIARIVTLQRICSCASTLRSWNAGWQGHFHLPLAMPTGLDLYSLKPVRSPCACFRIALCAHGAKKTFGDSTLKLPGGSLRYNCHFLQRAVAPRTAKVSHVLLLLPRRLLEIMKNLPVMCKNFPLATSRVFPCPQYVQRLGRFIQIRVGLAILLPVDQLSEGQD